MKFERKFSELELGRLNTYPVRSRRHKVSVADFAGRLGADVTFAEFAASLPNVYGSQNLRAIAEAVVSARAKGKPVVLGMGAHVIKCGLNPLLVQALEEGWLSAIALNGAGIIHDYEVAVNGETSEEVAHSLVDGSFGMVTETLEEMNHAINHGYESGLGLGESMGQYLLGRAPTPPHLRHSIVAAAVRLGVPVTVHVAIGCDTIHMHPSANGAAIGAGSLRDFRILANVVKDLGDGGVFLNVGSAVIIPEVFLKALALARNLGFPAHGIVTANLDMLQHYRPSQNVVNRPTGASKDGVGYALTGHHEISIPLLFQIVRTELARRGLLAGAR